MSKINWEVIDRYEKKSNGRMKNKSQKIYKNIIDSLIDMNILSMKKEGNYSVSGCGTSLNLRLHFFRLFFTEEKYAKEFRDEVYGNAIYDVGITKWKEKGDDENE